MGKNYQKYQGPGIIPLFLGPYFTPLFEEGEDYYLKYFSDYKKHLRITNTLTTYQLSETILKVHMIKSFVFIKVLLGE